MAILQHSQNDQRETDQNARRGQGTIKNHHKSQNRVTTERP